MLNIKKTLTKILDALKADYVVEYGQSGNLHWRKWNSGRVDLWGLTSVTVTLVTVASYYHRGTASFSLPNGLFNTVESVNMVCGSGFWSGIQSYSTTSVTGYFFDVVNSSNYTVGLNVNIKGTWK